MKTEFHDFMLHQFFTEVHKLGPKIIVVTNGADGVYAYDDTMIYYHQSLPVDITSSVGAGDAFGSTFISQLLLGKDIGHAIRAGVINSASVISETTATEGLLPQSEIDSLIEDLDPKALQKFPIK
jgi:Sugar kinases, ribokinase family